MKKETKHQTLNRTFARRVGKSLSGLKQDLIDSTLPKYLYDPQKADLAKYDKIFLEIGFGMGEHFVNQIQENPDSLHIGVEVYINGVANALKQLDNCDCNNFMIWPDDLDLVLKKIPDNSLDGIYVLFPDPWHKRRSLKKRLFNQPRLDDFKDKLKNHGFVAFASDIDDYFDVACSLLKNDSDFTIKDNDFNSPHAGYIQTKYHSKAIREGRAAQFITAYFDNSK